MWDKIKTGPRRKYAALSSPMSKKNKLKFNYLMIYLKCWGKFQVERNQKKKIITMSDKANNKCRTEKNEQIQEWLGFRVHKTTKLPRDLMVRCMNLSAWRQICFPATVTWTKTNTNFFQTKFSNLKISKTNKQTKKHQLRIRKKFQIFLSWLQTFNSVKKNLFH